MRYYQLLVQQGWSVEWFRKGNIYPEDHINPGSRNNTVRKLVNAYPDDWKEVFPTVDEFDKIIPPIDISNIHIPKIKFL